MKAARAASILLLVAWSSSVGAAAALVPTTLVATPAQVRVGDTVNVSGDVCPTGQTVTAVLQQTLPSFSKGLPPFVPIDMTAIGLAQTAAGVSFHVTATQARTSLNFQVNCGDGTSATTATPTKVYPPVGQFWWLAAYDTFVVSQGQLFFFTLTSLDCAPGTTATGSITAPGAHTPLLTMTSTVGPTGNIEFDMQLPTPMVAGTYRGKVSCTTAQGTTITNSTPIFVQGSGTPVPATGWSGSVAWIATAILALGLLLRRTARRPAR